MPSIATQAPVHQGKVVFKFFGGSVGVAAPAFLASMPQANQDKVEEDSVEFSRGYPHGARVTFPNAGGILIEPGAEFLRDRNLAVGRAQLVDGPVQLGNVVTDDGVAGALQGFPSGVRG